MQMLVKDTAKLCYLEGWVECVICKYMVSEIKKQDISGWTCILCGAVVQQVPKQSFSFFVKRDSFGVPELVRAALRLGGLDAALEAFKDFS